MNTLQEKAGQLRLADTKYHLFLCAGAETPKCCGPEKSERSWNHLKARCKELLDRDIVIQRSKAGCLRICQQGPVAVVYPDGVWYHSCFPEQLDEIIASHLLNGMPVESLRIRSTSTEELSDNASEKITGV